MSFCKIMSKGIFLLLALKTASNLEKNQGKTFSYKLIKKKFKTGLKNPINYSLLKKYLLNYYILSRILLYYILHWLILMTK